MSGKKYSYILHKNDLPNDLTLGSVVAIDTETMGLSHYRDRLCLVQVSDGNGVAHLVQIPPLAAGEGNGARNAPNLAKLLADSAKLKLFHFARFDIAALYKHFGVVTRPVYCTKIASRLARSFTDKHGLKDVCKDVLDIEISKMQQSSDWGAVTLSDEQLRYAATDVYYLHDIKAKLDEILVREARMALVQACCQFLPERALLDLAGWEADIFAH
ncbi:MAG: ribonuclease D [Alphaproteobacteria bacterium]|nr:ribonuclease D [Alphaproteobacteria bacterium]